MTATSPPPPREPIHWRRRPLVVRVGPWSVRSSVRVALVLGALGVLAVALAILAVGVGKYEVSPAAVVDVLLGRDHSFNRVVVLEWRAPRALLALLIGAALGTSGAIFQALTRNPLGSPDIIGFTTGAYTGALVVIGVIGAADYYLTAGGALVGGLATAGIVYGFARKDGGVQGFRLIVVGIAVGATLTAVNQWIIIRVDLQTARAADVWSQGTLNGLEWAQAVPVALCLAVLVGLLARLGPRLAVMQMGDDAAGALGIRPDRTRVALLALGVA
ncbi:MAG: iron chelate uptake ABC transporter family permease subunit, partial [Patulibacter sp.]